MPPPTGANLASLGYAPIRRRSSASSCMGVKEIVDAAFAKVDVNGDGKLSPSEIASSLKELLNLSDPLNDADCICAAVDADHDGFINIDEFHDFIMPTVTHHLTSGKEVEVERCLKDAFSNVLKDAKAKRDGIIQAFMETEKAVCSKTTKGSSSSLFSKSWMHKIYDEMYNNPTSPDAPCYRAARGEYLKTKLKELVDEDDKRTKRAQANFNPHAPPKKGESAADKRRAEFRKAIEAPEDSDLVRSFASLWLEKIEFQEAARRSSSGNDSVNCARG